ncbi:MAG: suppressor of fused domain protein [Pseudobutyrivibrio sp.]|nr:suppressor of fused domain protein [Pseudobutyrivibrio sp.]
MFFNKKKKSDLYLYSDREITEYEEHIIKHFGEFKEVFHEIASPDIHLDVIVIEPTAEEPYYKLITEGAGAYKQNAPKEYADKNGHFAEYMIFLPSDWDIKSDKSSSYWPIGELKKIARLPITCDTWLGAGHTVHSNEKMEQIDASTKLNSYILFSGIDKAGENCELRLKSGKLIKFYLLMPLYQEELDYIFENGGGAFLNLIPDEDLLPIVKPKRISYVE